MERLNWKEYFMNIAVAVGKRSTCLRRQYGAVIVKDNTIVATGYNGSPRGYKNCCDVGVCERERLNIPKGERYELCQAVHAEQNAIVNCNPADLVGATIYIVGFNSDGSYASGKPCMLCERMLVNARISKAVYSCTNGETTFMTFSRPV